MSPSGYQKRRKAMIDLSADSVFQRAKRTGFIKDNLEKVMRLIDVLEAVFATKWEEKLALKGGTAINMFYMNMPRLSIDIDLDYVGENKEEMLANKEELRIFLERFLFAKGYSLTKGSKYHFGLDSYVFQYLNNAGNKDIIKIEINFLDRCHIFPFDKKLIRVLGYIGEVEINVLNKYELYGSKAAALLSRSTPRDVYDFYRVINAQNVIEEIDTLRKCLVFYNCVGGNADVLEFDTNLLGLLSKRDFNRLRKPLLSKNERFYYKIALETVTTYLKFLLKFSPSEEAFISKFRNREYVPSLLFGDDEITNRIKRHPMALRKCHFINE